jgi:hypothetical protein
MRRWVGVCLAVIAGVSIAVIVLPAVARGYATATGLQRRAITDVVRNKWRSEVPHPCPPDVGGPTVFHLDSARISSIYPRYAFARVRDDGCTYTTGYFLKRSSLHGIRWLVLARQIDSGQTCSDFAAVPGPVLVEFSIEEVRGSGDQQLCGRKTGPPFCDQFGAAYAVNTTCAVEVRVARLYGAQCIPRSYRRGPLPPCKRSLAGFRCVASGDLYAVVNCVAGDRRVGLHLAE